jgi:hypothetical protein
VLFGKCHFYCQDYVALFMLIIIPISNVAVHAIHKQRKKKRNNHKSNYQGREENIICCGVSK